jgi:hypothetical protein
VTYGDIGFSSTPRLLANGKLVSGATQAVQQDPAIAALRARDLGTRASGERTELAALAPLKAGDNVIELLGGAHALDIDYLEITQRQ